MLITVECLTCGEEARKVRVVALQEVHQFIELVYKGQVSEPVTSQQFITSRLYCRNCAYSTDIQLIDLN